MTKERRPYEPDLSSSNVVARYKPNTSGYIPVILISGLALAGIIEYRMLGQSSEERLVTLTMLCFLAAGSGIFAIVFSSIKIHTIEITSQELWTSSRTASETHTRATTCFELQDTPRGLRKDLQEVILRTSSSPETAKMKSRRCVSMPIKPDPDLQEFVRQIEKSNPQVNTSKFWRGSTKPKRR